MEKKSSVNINRLEQLLDKKGWDAGELALYSGVKYNTVYSLKTGRRPNTRAETLTKIAQALDTSVDYLLGETDDSLPPAIQLPADIRRLAEIATRLSRTRQEELLRVAALLAELEQEQAARINYVAASGALIKIIDEHRDYADDLLPLLEELERRMPAWLEDGRSGEDTDGPIEGH